MIIVMKISKIITNIREGTMITIVELREIMLGMPIQIEVEEGTIIIIID